MPKDTINPAAAAAPPPDRKPLTELQATRLAAVTGLSAKDFAGASVAEISEKFRWQIDPELLFFRRICGKVVKRVNGVDYPVPYATVHVEDTDCSFLGLFPVENPFAWFFPITCRREEIGTVRTDACGRFCIWIPRFEIDWILRFRRERICFPDIFVKPNLRDILPLLEAQPVRPHINDPDPPPQLTRRGPETLRQAEGLLGRQTVERLTALELSSTFGGSAKQQIEMLHAPAFPHSLPPPLPAEFRQRPSGANGVKALRDTLASRVNLDAAVLEKFDVSRFVGPFIRCIDVIVPEWVPVFDVPDITFRVTQDVNGDGTEETIYSEGFFDVRWNSGNIPDITLTASPIAIAGHVCDAPNVPCSNTPAIQFAGLMPLANPALPADPYIDAAAGYAKRPNRPHPSGLISDAMTHPLGEAPYTGTLQLYGCNRVNNAAFYRIKYSYNGAPAVPFVGLTWPLNKIVGGMVVSHWPASDASGWYPVLPAADGWFPDLLLIEWRTTDFADGLYTLTLEHGDGAKNVIGTSAAVGLRIDNSAPNAGFTGLRWRKSGGAWVTEPVPLTCVVIPRGVVPADIEVEISYSVSANHLRSLQIGGSGCGAGVPVLISAPSTAEHWHTNTADNSFASTARFSISAAAAPGAYSFNLIATSRAFNPSAGDGGHLVDWNYNPVYNYVWPSLPIAVVNA